MQFTNKKYMVGSSLLNLSDSKDVDYITFDRELYLREKSKYDIMFLDEKEFLSHLNFTSNNMIHKIFNYQCDRDIIGQDFPIEYHILDHKEQLIELINEIIEYKLLNFNNRVTANGKYCSKIIYHIAYNIFILQNNSITVTDEQKQIIQQIHDCKMPIEYLEEFKNIFNEIKREALK